jgi:hypothetical protein
VDEGRDQPPGRESGPPLAAGVRLSPVQEAYGRYARHFNRCVACRDVDHTCPAGLDLWRAYEAQGHVAARTLSRTPRRS